MLEKSVNGICSMPVSVFSYLTLREAALDPKVTSIKLHYIDWLRILRLLVRSSMLPKNGKKTVQIELQAVLMKLLIFRAEQMQLEGIELIFGIKGLKVQQKYVIERMEQDKIRRYGFISTGNFNESTAKVIPM
jgi:polyphosphate kinase